MLDKLVGVIIAVLIVVAPLLLFWLVRLATRYFLRQKSKKTKSFVTDIPKAEWVDPTSKSKVVYPPYIALDHKHSLKLTGWVSKSKYGSPQNDPAARLSFTCKKRECGYYAEISRYNYRDLVLDRSNVNQFWPE
jgi:hypothetical protein